MNLFKIFSISILFNLFNLLTYANTVDIVEQTTNRQKLIISSSTEECIVTLNFLEKIIIETSCSEITNSKNIRILCTKNKTICKTEDELFLLHDNPRYDVDLIDIFKNLTYRINNKKITLINGSYKTKPLAVEGEIDLFYYTEYNFVEILAKGDMTGNKNDEYLVLISFYSSPDEVSYAPKHIIAMIEKYENKYTVTSVSNEYWRDRRTSCISSKIENKVLIQKCREYGSSDAMCCPSKFINLKWKVKNNKLIKVK